MSTSTRQVEANRQNSCKSTGPKTLAGKAAVATNALRHGILSERLVLDHEREEDFRDLFDDLVHSLRPSGAIETTLVEKIAINVWRQRRLVGAEWAAIQSSTRPSEIAAAVSGQLGIGIESPDRVTESDLAGFDSQKLEWCQGVLAEFEALPRGVYSIRAQLEQLAPHIYEELVRDADRKGRSARDALDLDQETFLLFIAGLLRRCRQEVAKAERFPLVREVTGWVQAARSIPRYEVRERLARYQTTLDNELYKALKALREAQQWRLATLDPVEHAADSA